MNTPSLLALRRENPRSRAGFADSLAASEEAVRERIAAPHLVPAGPRRPRRRRVVPVSTAVVAAAGLAVAASLTVDPLGPTGVRRLHAALGAAGTVTPMAVQLRLARRAAAGAFDLSPAAPIDGMSPATVDTHPLYAGETVARISRIRPAAEVAADLTP